ncbi:hypothetical protein PISMIDRAFT_687021 [Pisolithus microcarpus 441]|uniref:Uncharacterized protein n=1 Tax=Pisolithus microcarpus 441 TaxID=765257 RepID=A0A0C9Z785_9AGAM|nr:hypothetical protein PISMIDRAFT_687021 [Pisolithus microcarpus 441]
MCIQATTRRGPTGPTFLSEESNPCGLPLCITDAVIGEYFNLLIHVSYMCLQILVSLPR